MADLYDFTKDLQPTLDQRVWYFINAGLVAAVPVYLYHSVFGLDVVDTAMLYGSVSLLAIIVISLAYHNVTYWLKRRLMNQRDGLVTLNLVAAAEGKKDKEIVKKHKLAQQVNTTNESIAFSILYNNLMFLASFSVLAFFVFPTVTPPINYVISVVLSAGLLNFASSSAQIGRAHV